MGVSISFSCSCVENKGKVSVYVAGFQGFLGDSPCSIGINILESCGRQRVLPIEQQKTLVGAELQ